MKFLIIICLQLNIWICYSQNYSYRVIYDSLESLLSVDYLSAKNLMTSLEKQYVVDPAEKLLFLTSSLRYNDIRYFKKTIKKLMKYNGVRFSKKDTLESARSDDFFSLIDEKGLNEWILSKSNKFYPYWVKNNPNSFEIKQEIDKCILRDQYYRNSIPYSWYTDSICEQSLHINRVLKQLDFQNLISIIHLCDSNGILPNHIDNGVGTYYTWSVILYHNLSYKEDFFKIWDLIFPYLERTYLAGKIGDDFFRMYDRMVFNFFGYQYYGFEKGAPIKDEEHYLERKKKYGLL